MLFRLLVLWCNVLHSSEFRFVERVAKKRVRVSRLTTSSCSLWILWYQVYLYNVHIYLFHSLVLRLIITWDRIKLAFKLLSLCNIMEDIRFVKVQILFLILITSIIHTLIIRIAFLLPSYFHISFSLGSSCQHILFLPHTHIFVHCFTI